MKKLLVLALVAMIGATGFSKTLDEVFNAFPKADNVQEMTIDKSMLAMAKSMGGDKAQQMKDIDAMRVIAIEKPSSEQLAILKAVMDEGVEGFDILVDADEDGEHALILTQGNEKEIPKMLILATTEEEVAIVLIEGKIDPSNVDKLMKLGK
jgi:hypothetical protein